MPLNFLSLRRLRPFDPETYQHGSSQSAIYVDLANYFTPLVCDTLQVPKENDKAKYLNIKEKNVVLTNPENPLLYEACNPIAA